MGNGPRVSSAAPGLVPSYGLSFRPSASLLSSLLFSLRISRPPRFERLSFPALLWIWRCQSPPIHSWWFSLPHFCRFLVLPERRGEFFRRSTLRELWLRDRNNPFPQ